jgi:hypothetical protein
MVLALGDEPADRPHVAGPPGSVEGRGASLIGGQCRRLFLCRFRVALDGGLGLMAGDPVAERDQVVLGGGLRLAEFPLPTSAGGARDQEETEHAHREEDTGRDQEIA